MLLIVAIKWFIHLELNNLIQNSPEPSQVVQSIISLILTNLLTVVAKVLFSNTYIFLLQKMWIAFYVFFSAKNMNVFAIFQDNNFNVKLANSFVTVWTTGHSKSSTKWESVWGSEIIKTFAWYICGRYVSRVTTHDVSLATGAFYMLTPDLHWR